MTLYHYVHVPQYDPIKQCVTKVLPQICIPDKLINVHILKANYMIPDIHHYLGRRMGKPTICIGENKAADQPCSNCKADQRL